MKVSKIKDVDILWLHSLYSDGSTQTQLGKIVGVDARTISRWFINNGLFTRNKCPKELNDESWLYNKYCIDGKSALEISEEVKCSVGLVHKAIKKLSIPLKHPECNNSYPELHNKEWLFTQYITLKKSTVDIANHIGCDVSAVLRRIYSFGIKSRGKSVANKGRVFTDEHKLNLSLSRVGVYSGDKNPNWRGGISLDPYCYKFNKPLKDQIRDKYGRMCLLCKKPEIDELENLNRHLSVHHVDYDKEQGCNGKKILLVPLCCSCNFKVNYNRDYWKNEILTKIQEVDHYSR